MPLLRSLLKHQGAAAIDMALLRSFSTRSAVGLRRFFMVSVHVRSKGRLRMTEPIIDLQSDHFFMGEALRQAARAYEAEEVPIGAVVVREGRIIARAFNQVE